MVPPLESTSPLSHVVTKPGGDTLPRLVRLKLAHMRSTLIWLLLATGLADLLATGRRRRPRVAERQP